MVKQLFFEELKRHLSITSRVVLMLNLAVEADKGLTNMQCTFYIGEEKMAVLMSRNPKPGIFQNLNRENFLLTD